MALWTLGTNLGIGTASLEEIITGHHECASNRVIGRTVRRTILLFWISCVGCSIGADSGVGRAQAASADAKPRWPGHDGFDSSDPRLGRLAGRWELEFSLGESKSPHASQRRGSGWLIFVETSTSPRRLMGTGFADLSPLLGKPVSCERRDSTPVAYLEDSEVVVRFSPEARGCGIVARLLVDGEQLTGSWCTDSTIGCTATGGLRGRKGPARRSP